MKLKIIVKIENPLCKTRQCLKTYKIIIRLLFDSIVTYLATICK